VRRECSRKTQELASRFGSKLHEDLTDEELKVYLDRLEFEIDVIVRMGFPGYFLIVADFIKWAKAQGIPVGPGRGSGAGSLVAVVADHHRPRPDQARPAVRALPQPERVSMPDFDIDFCETRRGEVIRYVRSATGRTRSRRSSRSASSRPARCCATRGASCR
jgi:DNA polymerase-3 subunit alpha